MGVPTSEVGYTIAKTRRENHESSYEYVVALGKKNFITQGNYIGYMFRLLISHLQAYFCQLIHKMLCTLWDPIVFTFMEYIKLNHLSQ